MGALQHNSDITFIGSGISTSFSIINFLDVIDKEENPVVPIRVTIIEKYPEFNLGIPYGSRSGFSTLLITSLKNFLPEPELSLFIQWLNKNKTWLIKEFIKEGGYLSKKWLEEHKEAIDNNNWDALFIPRRFFGCYTNTKLKNKIDALEKKRLVEFNFINGEVIDIEKTDTLYNIILEDNVKLSSKKVVLSVGSLPTIHLWKKRDVILDKHLMFINTPYKPELKVNLKKINDSIKQRKHESATNILIVGANASALELLYKINDTSNNTIANNTTFTLLSSQGEAPDASVEIERKKAFIPQNLKTLQSKENISAELIAEATFKDLDFADNIKLGPASTVETISRYFGVLLDKLSKEELEIFACKYGNEIGKRQRCAGLHYSNVITNLGDQKRFNHIAGRFVRMEQQHNDEYHLVYKDRITSNEKTHPLPFHIVINCAGGKNLTQKDIPLIYKNLIDKNYCIPNTSKIGFHVNDKLEASPNLHIMGPMLAGNVIENKAVWHVEHCGRIIWLSKVLSKILYNDLIKDNTAETKIYKFKAKKLNSDVTIEKYRNLLKTNWNNNIYYTYDHLKYFENKTSKLKYFLLKINGEPKIIMPIIMRQILMKNTPTEFYDTITPYGYSGPLFDSSVKQSDIKVFWEFISDWYKKHNVVSEFIRFNLNRNHFKYNGLLLETLSNVKGKLKDNFQEQWENFLPKVRNNYRKAVSNNLDFKIFNGKEINEHIVNIFFNIYTNTMKRLNAKAIYYFSLEYFKTLVFNNIDSFSIALVYKDDVVISTELIIKNYDTIYAFLGGTDANHYQYRPNDFLRVEVIKWGIKNYFNTYVLGGGLKDEDNLYKSKKAYFPKDENSIFYTGRKIVNHEVYKNLCETLLNEHNTIESGMRNLFFPLYRLT